MADGISANRNIVMVTVDSLRADYCYDTDIPTPAIDTLADSGVRFTTAISPGPATYESMPAIFTGTQLGQSADSGGVNKQEHISEHLRAHRPLPVRLQERGYTTIGVTPNPFTSRQFGFDRGFDRFVDFLDSSGFGGSIQQRIVSRWSNGDFVGGLRFASNMLGLGDVSVSCAEVVSRAISEMAESSEPVFLWLMFLDPHWPYRPPRQYREGVGLLERYRANWRSSNLSDTTPDDRDTEVLRRLYEGTIRSVDDCLGTLRERLDEYDPVYVVHADHGEAFGEHGRFGHGGLLYDENVRVPLVVGNIGDRADVTQPTSLRAMPRLVTGLSDGVLESAETERTYATAESGDFCIRGSWWTYYVSGDDCGRIYDHRTDPEQKRGTETDIDGLREKYRARLNEMGALKTASREGLTTERL